MFYKLLNISFILSIILWASACSEIESGNSEIASAGIYIGTITPTGGVQGSAMAIISSTDVVTIVNRDTMETFIGTRSDNSLAGTLYASTVVDSTAEILFVSGSNISGTYDSALGGGTFALTALTTLYNRSADLSKLIGVWIDSTFTTAVGETTWSILSGDGSFEVTANACSATGNFYLIDQTRNEYGMVMNVVNCGSLDGVHSGLAILSDSSGVSQDDTLSVIFANGVVGGIFEPVKQ